MLHEVSALCTPCEIGAGAGVRDGAWGMLVGFSGVSYVDADASRHICYLHIIVLVGYSKLQLPMRHIPSVLWACKRVSRLVPCRVG